MAKSGKIKDLELTNINEQNTALQKAVFDMGALEIEKAQVLQRYESALKVLEETKKELEAKYGPVNINLKTGVWEEIAKEEPAVEEPAEEELAEEEDCGCEEKEEDCEDCDDKE